MNRIVFALTLTLALMVGAILSYMGVVGYYLSLELKVPEKPAISISSFKVSADNPTFFNITVLNPTFSPGEAVISGINVLVSEGNVYKVISTEPPIPSGGYRLKVGASETFKCFWAWANYTGQSISIVVFVKDGSGAVFTATLPLVAVEIGDLEFDPGKGESFNISIRSGEKSAVSVDLEGIRVIVDGSVYDVESEPPLPINLNPGDSLNLTCKWNWAAYQGGSITVIVRTRQGYIGRIESVIPTYVAFNVSRVTFDPNNTSCFNFTVSMSSFHESLNALNVTEVTIMLKDGSILKPSKTVPELPYVLKASSATTFTCEWGWASYAGEEVTITINTSQGYSLSFQHVIPHLPRGKGEDTVLSPYIFFRDLSRANKASSGFLSAVMYEPTTATLAPALRISAIV